MGNKLKKMIQRQNDGLAFSLDFKNLNDKNAFQKAVQEVYHTGIPQKTVSPISMEMKKTKGDYQYPYENISNIMDFMVFPSTEKISFPIVVDGHQSEYFFSRIITDEYIKLTSYDSTIIDVTILFFKDDNTMKFTYKSTPNKAKNIDDLIEAYEKFLSFIEILFQKKDSIDQINDMKQYFNQSLVSFKRSKELSEILNIELTPEKLIEVDDSDAFIEKLYLLLVEKRILRQNDKLNHVETVNVEKMEIGQELFATYIATCYFELFGEKKDIYFVNCFFGAEIKNVEKKEDGYIVYFKDSEKRPMYKAYSAYLHKEEAEYELNKINTELEQRKKYYNAVDWGEQLNNLLDMD